MQFSSFSRTVDNLIITLYNEIPIENVKTLLFYSDNSQGVFTKKEFRWSFDDNYWAAWEALTPVAFSHVNIGDHYYLFLQFRYILSAIDSGNVSTITINYSVNSASTTPIHTNALHDASSLIINDVVQRYVLTEIVDASTLNGYSGNWYLNRTHHIGQQPIASITGLQTTLNNLESASGVTYEYVDGSLNYIKNNYLRESSIGSGFRWNVGLLDVSVQGDVTKAYVDASIAKFATNSSVGLAFYSNASLGSLSSASAIYNTSIGWLDSSIKRIYPLVYALNTSMGPGLATYATNTSVGLAFASNASMGNLSQSINIINSSIAALDASINNVTDALTIFYTKTQIDGSFALNTALISYATNTSVGLAQLTDVSVGRLSVLVNALNASMGSGLITYATNSSVGLAFYSNASLGTTSILTSALNASMGSGLITYATNTSVGLAFASNASLGTTSTLTAAINSSLYNAYVPYTGARTDVSFNNKNLTQVNAIQFNTAPTGLGSPKGQMWYDNSNNTLAINLGDKGVTLQVGEESYAYGYNYTTATILNGQAVYVINASSSFPLFGLAKADALITSRVVGIATQDISVGYQGYVTNFGAVHSTSTNTWSAGDVLYLSGTTAGALTNTIPTTDYIVKVGQALDSSAIGTLFINPERQTINFATNTSVGLSFYSNVSLGNLSSASAIYNVSIGWLDSSIKKIYPLVYALNASMGPGLVTYATNTSVGLAFASNASLGTTSVLTSALNASMGAGLVTYATNSSVGLAFYSNASIGSSSSRISITDTSVYNMFSIFKKISVSTNAPASPTLYDLWIDISIL